MNYKQLLNELADNPQLAYHVTPRRNLNKIMRTGLVPTIGANSTELGETEKRVYLFPSLEDVADALGNWLGELYDEEIVLALLEVNVDGLHLESDAGYELATTDLITPDRIKVLTKDIDTFKF